MTTAGCGSEEGSVRAGGSGDGIGGEYDSSQRKRCQQRWQQQRKEAAMKMAAGEMMTGRINLQQRSAASVEGG